MTTPTTETGIVEPKAWIDESGTLRAPEGYAFESVDLPGFDASGYPRKGVRLAPLMGFTPPRAAIAAMPDSTQLLQTMAGVLEAVAKAERDYRVALLTHGNGSDGSELAWKAMKRAGDAAREVIAQFRAQEQRS